MARSLPLRAQAISDAVLACLRNSPTMLQVNHIRHELGDTFGYFSYGDVATALYRLERNGIIPPRVNDDPKITYWLAPEPDDDLETLWGLEARDHA